MARRHGGYVDRSAFFAGSRYVYAILLLNENCTDSQRIVEGEFRILMIGTEPAQIIHKKLAGDGGRASYASYKPEDAEFALLMSNFKADLPRLMPSFRLSGHSLPLLWTVDFILGDKNADG